jgi:acetyltransferase-like isoleucine patch superfamily enzyme
MSLCQEEDMVLINGFIGLIKDILSKLELRRYSPENIELYFRKLGCQVGNNNRIFITDVGSEPYLVKIGNSCVIANGVKFITHDGAVSIFRDEINNLNVFGKIEVKDKCFIGMNSIILPDVTIGPNSIVGAGSVVTKDVPAGMVVAGVPARILCSVDEYKSKCVKQWKALSLHGSRKEWEKQLKEYFWGKVKI